MDSACDTVIPKYCKQKYHPLSAPQKKKERKEEKKKKIYLRNHPGIVLKIFSLLASFHCARRYPVGQYRRIAFSGIAHLYAIILTYQGRCAPVRIVA